MLIMNPLLQEVTRILPMTATRKRSKILFCIKTISLSETIHSVIKPHTIKTIKNILPKCLKERMTPREIDLLISSWAMLILKSKLKLKASKILKENFFY